MNLLNQIKARLAALFRRRELDADMDDEMHSHIEMRTQANIESGMNPEEARFAALRQFGWTESIKEDCREQRGVTWLENLVQDIRYGARQLRKNPGFTGVAVLTLALGIGANSVIFSLVHALLLHPLPVERPEQLAAVYTSDFSGTQYGTSSYPDYVDFRDRNQVFSGTVAYMPTAFSLNIDGATERAFGEIVSGNYFSTLGVAPALGRGFLPEEDRTPGERAVAVISHKLWQNRFGGDPDILGRAIKLNGHPFTIVGVAPEKHSGLIRGIASDLWVPAMMMKEASPGSDHRVERWSRGFLVMGRLKPDVTLDQAQADFRRIAEQLFREWPQQWTNIRNQSRIISLLPEGQARVMPDLRTPIVIFMAMLMAVVGLVLLIACANVANLFLARATARRKEIAIRLSLGVSRGRLIRQLITESVLVALVGGGVGLLIAAWGTGFLTAFKPPTQFPIELDMEANWRVLGFTFGLSLLSGVLFGLAPALAVSRPALVASLKDEAGGATGRGRLRGALVIAQVALSLMLLICSGLFMRGLRNAGSVDPGFDADNLLVMSMDLQLQGYSETTGRNFSRQLLDRARALPGVVSGSMTDELPLVITGGSRRGITIEGYAAQPGEGREVNSSSVTPGYFETLNIPVLRGRAFNEQDREGSPGVVIVNEAFTRRYWPGQDPIGKRIQMGGSFGGSNNSPYLEVIGAVGDGKYVTLGEEARPFFFMNLAQQYQSSRTLIVRTRGNPLDYLPAVRSEVAALDKNLPLYDVKTMRQHLGLALLPTRLAGSVLGVFGLVALIMAAAGIYGVMAYSVVQRTREIGVRMALGASAGAVLRLVVRSGMTLTIAGVAIGVAASLALTRLMKTILFGVSATDPVTFVAITLLLIVVALLACWIPARRAAKVDPMKALRYE
jgi:predicted permease